MDVPRATFFPRDSAFLWLIQDAARWPRPEHMPAGSARIERNDRRKGSFTLRLWSITRSDAVNFMWRITSGKNVVGAGTMVSRDVRESRDGARTIEVGAAVIDAAYRGQRLYPKILKKLRVLLATPLESDVEMSPGAVSAWQHADASVAKRGDKPVFRLNPRRA